MDGGEPDFQDPAFNLKRESTWRLDFAKRAVSIEVAFNHGEATAWNFLKPVLASEKNHIDKAITTEAGMVITATQGMKARGGFDGACGTFENFQKYLSALNPIVTVPILLIGLEPPEAFQIEHLRKVNNAWRGDVRLLRPLAEGTLARIAVSRIRTTAFCGSQKGASSPSASRSPATNLRMNRDLETAKNYFLKRYAEAPAARYGLVASSRDKVLAEWGIPNDYQSTKVMRLGPWYGDGEESHRSCRHLRECVTEFGAQGLELDGVLLAWGTDLLWTGDAWSNARAKNHARGTHVRDPYQLRVNAYRVLLTRGRDGAVIFVPPWPNSTQPLPGCRGTG